MEDKHQHPAAGIAWVLRAIHTNNTSRFVALVSQPFRLQQYGKGAHWRVPDRSQELITIKNHGSGRYRPKYLRPSLQSTNDAAFFRSMATPKTTHLPLKTRSEDEANRLQKELEENRAAIDDSNAAFCKTVNEL